MLTSSLVTAALHTLSSSDIMIDDASSYPTVSHSNSGEEKAEISARRWYQTSCAYLESKCTISALVCCLFLS